MSTTAVLPLFPLNTVLFPGGPLALRIFEARYVDMIGRCMREDSPFGVVLIRAGTEVGPVSDTAEVGTTARIRDFHTTADGLLGISCIGDRKFRILKRWLQSDGLHMGEVEYQPPEATVGLPDDFRHLAELLRKVLPQLEEAYAKIPERFDDASWVGCRLAEILPLDLPEKLQLLDLDDPIARLSNVSSRLVLQP
jgi:Lon protease-like protein